MIPAKPFFPFPGGMMIALSAAMLSIAAQETHPPSRPESRIHDEGSIFNSPDKVTAAEKIRGRLDALQAETGCDILIATVTTSTGTTPRLLADQFAATWLKSDQTGAVLVYERAANRLAISATQAARDSIADYDFAAIEESLSGNREDTAPADAVSLAAGDLAALFRKNFGEEASREHPSVKADRVLFGIVSVCIIGLIALVAALHWRGERVRV